MTALALVLGLVAAELATPTGRGEIPRFVVVPLAEEDAHRLDPLYGALEAAGARVVDREARMGIDLAIDAKAFESARLDDVRDSLLAAKAAHKELDLEQVDRALEEAFATLLRLPAPAEHVDVVADVLLSRAELALARGQAKPAAADLRLLARLDPTREELHPGLFSPTVVAAFASARADNGAAPSAFLAVRADGGSAPARVVVDGVPLLVGGSLESRDVGAGPHLVTVSAEGRLSRSFVLDLAAGATLVLEAHLPVPDAGERRAQARARLAEGDRGEETLRELADLAGATAVLVVGEGAPRVWSGLAGLVQLSEAEAKGEDPLVLADAALRAAREPPVRLPAVPPPAAPEEGVEPAALALAAGGAAAAVVVVAAGVGILVWALQPAEQVSPPPRPVVITGFSVERR